MSENRERITCWCGAEGTYHELFHDVGLQRKCGGSGELRCRCGGDLCVCHNHGHAECLGCEDCEPDDFDDYDDRPLTSDK